MYRGGGVALGVGLLALALASGCGYRLAGSGVGGVGSIAIRTPRNDSFQPGVEYVVADALRRELLRRSGSALVEDPMNAEVVVSGRVLPVETRPQSLSSAILAREQEVTLALDLQAVRRDGTPLSLHFANDGHWRPSGHDLAAASIAARLRELAK